MKLSVSILKLVACLLVGLILAGCASQVKTPPPSPTPHATVPPFPTEPPYVFVTFTPWPTRTPIPSKTPTFTPPPLPGFSGRLLLLTGMVELRWLNFTSGSASLEEPFTRGAFSMGISPDRKSLVFSGWKDDITLVDLTTGEMKPLVADHSRCFSWSPSNTRFTYTTYKPPSALYSYDLASGKSTRIVDFPCGNYFGDLGANMTSGPGEGTLCGGMTCGVWMDDTHLFFQRFTGELPETITYTVRGIYPALLSKLTSLASLDEKGRLVNLVDSPERWYESERCPYGPYLLLRNSSEAGNILHISPVFTDFAGLQPRPLPDTENLERVVGFADPQCNLLYRKESALYKDRWVTLVDPETLEETYKSAYLPTKYVLSDGGKALGDWSWEGVWIGDPQDRVMALRRTSEKGSAVILVDLDTGSYTILADIDEANLDILAYQPSSNR